MTFSYRRSIGFSLVEVTLALGVAGFSLLAIFALLPIGLTSNQTSIEQTEAAGIAAAIVADLRQAPTVSQIAVNSNLKPVSPKLSVDVTQAVASGYVDAVGGLTPASSSSLSSTSITASTKYKVTVALTPPVSGRAATVGTVVAGWPASAKNAVGSVAVFVALDRN